MMTVLANGCILVVTMQGEYQSMSDIPTHTPWPEAWDVVLNVFGSPLGLLMRLQMFLCHVNGTPRRLGGRVVTASG